MGKSIYNYPVHSQIGAAFEILVDKGGFKLQFSDSWRHDKELFVLPLIEPLYQIEQYVATSGNKRETFLINFGEGVAEVTFSKQYISTQIAVANHVAYTKFLKRVKTYFREEQDNPESDQVEIKFWYNTNSGPVSVNREITVPSWEEITDNYSKVTKEPLNALISNFKPTEKTGQLILWHGIPGTGKTYALRSLIKSWRSWCGGEYIMDPEALFGYSPGYLINMILSGSEEYYDDEEESVVTPSKWRLLILEDTGELLKESAKDTAGQGLSRLLNLVDGLIGQGLKVLVLITTNEQIEKLHPAVSRDGRCLAAIKFEPFSEIESKEWAEKHGVEEEITKGHTLAELFSKTKAAKQIQTELKQTKKGTLGFVPR